MCSAMFINANPTTPRLSTYSTLYFSNIKLIVQGGSNITGTNCDLFTHNESRSYLNHLVQCHLRTLCQISLFPLGFPTITFYQFFLFQMRTACLFKNIWWHVQTQKCGNCSIIILLSVFWSKYSHKHLFSHTLNKWFYLKTRKKVTAVLKNGKSHTLSF
jgi:hypothetical protein